MKQVLGIAYGEHELQRLDLYLPEKDYFPVFVYFHGGGMEKGDKEREKDIAAALCGMGVGLCAYAVLRRERGYLRGRQLCRRIPEHDAVL